MLSKKLTLEGQRVLSMLVSRYGMSSVNAEKLLHDGGASLAISLLTILRGMK